MLLESILESATLLCMDYTYSAVGFNHKYDFEFSYNRQMN